MLVGKKLSSCALVRRLHSDGLSASMWFGKYRFAGHNLRDELCRQLDPIAGHVVREIEAPNPLSVVADQAGATGNML